MSALVVPAADLLGSPGKQRPFEGTFDASLRFGDVTVDGPVRVSGMVTGQLDSVRADFTTSAVASLVCNRCLHDWEDEVSVEGTQFFRTTPDEDGYGLADDSLDIVPPALDELALALPSAPLCRQECKGLCPTCGTDLNRAPCDGHPADSESPFAALKDLFDS
ncbi:MAG: YceD family protein [Acidimicrobiia bacterium]